MQNPGNAYSNTFWVMQGEHPSFDAVCSMVDETREVAIHQALNAKVIVDRWIEWRDDETLELRTRPVNVRADLDEDEANRRWARKWAANKSWLDPVTGEVRYGRMVEVTEYRDSLYETGKAYVADSEYVVPVHLGDEWIVVHAAWRQYAPGTVPGWRNRYRVWQLEGLEFYPVGAGTDAAADDAVRAARAWADQLRTYRLYDAEGYPEGPYGGLVGTNEVPMTDETLERIDSMMRLGIRPVESAHDDYEG